MHCERGLLATDLTILDHGQVMSTFAELVPTSPNYHTTPTIGLLSLDRFNVQRPPLQREREKPKLRFVQHYNRQCIRNTKKNSK
ncbi:hypothetical protein TNCV_1755121 [Trichonephila clavipes]|nr:hypothetical protein TNCV_1755121 [Trichonephila clavipes]